MYTVYLKPTQHSLTPEMAKNVVFMNTLPSANTINNGGPTTGFEQSVSDKSV